MGFNDVTRYALQPSALMMDPDFARQQFVADLGRYGRMQQTSRERPEAQAHQAHDREVRGLHSGHQGFGYLAPGAGSDQHWNPREKPAGNPQQYLLDAIMRDNALAQYDRDAPRLRALQQGQ